MKTEDSHKNSLSEIFSREYKNFRRYVLRYLDEQLYRTSAEDIVQDVAVNMFSKPDFESPLENALGYIYRSLKNKIIDIQRKNSGSRDMEEYLPGNPEWEPGIPEPENEQRPDPDKFYANFYAAIDKLKPEQRQII